MVFDATINNIAVILWQSVLLVEEIGVPKKTTDLSQVTDKLFVESGVNHHNPNPSNSVFKREPLWS
jgi:hypothetical protein